MGIVWSKWKDPLARMVEDAEPQFGNTGPCLVGPIGLIPLHEDNLPSNLFKFWMGDASFGITHDDAELIEEVEGVESLDVFTRYRFRIAVGRAFDEKKVMGAIDRLFTPPKEVSGLDAVSRIMKVGGPAHSHWALYRMADGHVEAFRGTLREVQARGAVASEFAEEARWSWQ